MDQAENIAALEEIGSVIFSNADNRYLDIVMTAEVSRVLGQLRFELVCLMCGNTVLLIACFSL